MVVEYLLSKISAFLRWKWSLLLGLFFLSCTSVFFTIHVSEQTPYWTFKQARLALSFARHSGAAKYAPKALQAAEIQWELARAAWRQETRKWVFRRNYQTASQMAELTRQLSQQAARSAITARDSLRWRSMAQLALVKQKIDKFQNQFTHLPIENLDRQKFVTGEILMRESELALQRQDYLLAESKIRTAAAYVGSTNDKVTALLKSYREQLPEWKRMVNETIAWSKTNDAVAIVVEKMSYRCQIYNGGKLKAEFPIELGPNWLGHKQRRGDRATPEGQYHVIKKKGRGNTIYYKALEINYPNDRDRERFQAAQNRGEIAKNAHIGGLIEIHGDGGKGANWTSGCVALTNENMDHVFDWANIGTPVTIVGALNGDVFEDKITETDNSLSLNIKN